MREYMDNMHKLKSSRRDPTDLRVVEIVKSYMKEMVGSYKDEMLKEGENETEVGMATEVEKVKQLLGKPKKLK